MTDRELLELAAKAAKIELNNGKVPYVSSDGLAKGWKDWNPLTDDGDALRLAVDLKMSIHLDDNMVDVDPDGINWLSEAYMNDPYAATRRAIVRAAAEIGKAMP